MASSHPPSSLSLDGGWGLFSEDPPVDDEDDTRTVQVSSPWFKGPPSLEEATSDERDTLPPPVPVSEYVQTMMQQVGDDPEAAAQASPQLFSWHDALPPSSRDALGSELPRAPARPRRIESWGAPPQPPQPRPPLDDDDAFTLIAFEPERLGDMAGDFDEPRGRPGSLRAPGFDDLRFEDASAPSQRGAIGLRLPTPIPVYPSSRAPASMPPSSRREPDLASIPPILGMAWASAAPSVEPDDADNLGSSPLTQRGLAAPLRNERANPTTGRFGAIGDASVQPHPASAPRASISIPAPRTAPPPTPADPFDDVLELYEAGDFRSALVMAEALLEIEPQHADALTCAANCRETLSQKYLGRLGGLAKILRVAMPPDEIRWLSLDHKAGFLLSCIDGTSSIEEVLDVACMHEFEAIRILHDFRELGVIEILPDLRSSRR